MLLIIIISLIFGFVFLFSINTFLRFWFGVEFERDPTTNNQQPKLGGGAHELVVVVVVLLFRLPAIIFFAPCSKVP